MLPNSASVLSQVEHPLRALLPANLYAEVWLNPGSEKLMRVFEHLRTLQYILQDYMPRQVLETPLEPGQIRYSWQEGTLLFTDLAGFTSLTEAAAAYGRQGATTLLEVLNRYFSAMIEIISKSGGDLLEFTGDALLVRFIGDDRTHSMMQAVRAGLRMQRAMTHMQCIQIADQEVSLGMRIGLHSGHFLTADIGTPMRMVHVLLGGTVQAAKRTEGAGQTGRVCLPRTAIAHLPERFHYESVDDCYVLIQDDLTDEELGEYDINPARRRLYSPLLLDRSTESLMSEIHEIVERIEPLATYLPVPILTLLVENASRRRLPANFSEATVMFINLVGLPESVDKASPEEIDTIVTNFARIFSLINAAVKAQGGILQKVTYHLVGSDILVYFGVLNAHTDDAQRAAVVAVETRRLIQQLPPLLVGGQPIDIYARIGLTSGAVFAGEVGEPRGRREFNVLGDPVNTASRLTSRAHPHQILITEKIYQLIHHRFQCEFLGDFELKGKAESTALYALHDDIQENHH
jgi:class 3 adenylate cyclase